MREIHCCTAIHRRPAIIKIGASLGDCDFGNIIIVFYSNAVNRFVTRNFRVLYYNVNSLCTSIRFLSLSHPHRLSLSNN